jgi:glycosyltransferase involved in cell wall biosynthesis
MIPPSRLSLALFLSRATPLSRWRKAGVLGREIAIYKRLREHLSGISIVTSGGREELLYQEQLAGVEILCNRWGLSPNIYSLLAPILHRSKLRELDVYKSNQLDGAWTAIIAGKLYRKPVIVRAGYLWAGLNRSQSGRGVKSALIDKLQRHSLRLAGHVVFTTEAMRREAVSAFGIPPEKISVIPNYVDTEQHKPDLTIRKQPGRVCYVGRLHPVKNLPALIESIDGVAGASLVLIGDGDQRTELEALAQKLGVAATFRGVLPNEEITPEINGSDLFVLPSHTEGHPKALLEAMACGAAVLGSDVPGIRDIVSHGENGWLCQPAVGPLRDAIRFLLSDGALRQRLGTQARQDVERHFSIDRVCDAELQLLQAVFRG